MNPTALALPFLLALAAPLGAQEPTLILMGGSYRTCSSLLHADCRPEQRDFPGARGAPVYRLDAARFPEILDPAYWRDRPGAPSPAAIRAMLAAALKGDDGRSYDAGALTARFENADAGIWNALLVQEQDLILSAFEQPQTVDGRRRLEQVRIDGGNRPYDAALFRQLVAEAAKRSPGRKPRVAFTTSASANGFDAVDFYRALLEQAGAEAVWWPVDAAMAEARFAGTGGCLHLSAMRRTAFSMLGRERVFPDLDAEQRAACADPAALDAVPDTVQALFLDGGDQWLHWQTFFTRDGNPNPWLISVRAAFARGDLLVAGTSAGAAVQSGRHGMITNGLSANALTRGATHAGFSMPEGCERAKRCPPGVVEDDLTWWNRGGLGLIGPVLVDTHVSERRRELRLITLMTDIAAADGRGPEAGIGVDETSALTVRVKADGLMLEASGQSGVWWFEPPSARTPVGGWRLRGHYLAPGTTLQWSNGRMQLLTATPVLKPRADGSFDGGDALQPEALRTAVWSMVRDGYAATMLDAAGMRLTVRTTSETRHWQGPQGQQGITDLELTLSPAR